VSKMQTILAANGEQSAAPLTEQRVHNFYPGPGALPEQVIRSSMSALWNFEQSGIGLIEYSHRYHQVSNIIQLAKERIRRLANISDDYAILFLQGGGSNQFCMAPMNLALPETTIDFVHTGYWSGKAMTEAAKLAKVNIAATSERRGFRELPAASHYKWSENPAYIHYVSNNTIYGTQFKDVPSVPDNAVLVCDASSDIFSGPVDINRFGMVFASAHKNLGPAGLALVIVRKDLLDRADDKLPSILQYRTHYNADSLYNSAPMFNIYCIERVLHWLEEQGGLDVMASINQKKSALVYDFLDQSSLFKALIPNPEYRSQMNVCFKINNTILEEHFIQAAEVNGYRGLRGHSIVGDLRASLYNGVSLESCEKLVEFMSEYEKQALFEFG